MKYRIVNKGRFIAFVSVLLIVLAMVLMPLFGRVIARESRQGGYAEVRVCEGDTLWAIAKEYGRADRDIRENVYDICRLNGIRNSVIYPGQIILVPLAD